MSVDGMHNAGQDAELLPRRIVLIPGFGGVERLDYWKIDSLRAAFPDASFCPCFPGPFSSHHDRAREIFYMLRGGRVDYGEKHAAYFGHERFGRTYDQPLLPRGSWGDDSPVVLVGHSMGGVTARVLHQMLADGGFCEVRTNARWVSAIVTISSPHDGDPIVYALGARAVKELVADCASCQPPRLDLVRVLSIGWAIGLLIHLLAFFNLAHITDLGIDHWRLSRSRNERAWPRLVAALANSSPFISSADNLAHDATPEAMVSWNARLQTFPSTLYLSFAAEKPCAPPFAQLAAMVRCAEPLAALACVARFMMGLVGDMFALLATLVAPCGSGTLGHALETPRCRPCALRRLPSDGMLRCASQERPSNAPASELRLPRGAKLRGSAVARFASGAEMHAAARRIRATKLVLPRGEWLVSKLDNCDHFGICPFPLAAELPVQFFGLVLALVDAGLGGPTTP
ncbi:hypothetical protein KFE25_006005 [Diacronema lutheri]|uniref:Lipase-like C-terminal domain-containing protein n=1 Tax=Diacronema lutheri TaxID=2081491 RepID=A0A8J6CGW1_DIALT|nr:hypothetical protein KFE25_006005 [Diacronema lutheri]